MPDVTTIKMQSNSVVDQKPVSSLDFTTMDQESDATSSSSKRTNVKEDYKTILETCRTSASLLDQEILFQSLQKLLYFLFYRRSQLETDPSNKGSGNDDEIKSLVASTLLFDLDSTFILLLHTGRHHILDLWSQCLDLCGYWICLNCILQCLKEAATISNTKDEHKVSSDASSVRVSPSSLKASLHALKRIVLPEKNPTIIRDVLLDYVAHETQITENVIALQEDGYVSTVRVQLGRRSEKLERHNEKENACKPNVSQIQAIEELAHLVVMLPIKISSACHGMSESWRENSISLPLWTTRSKYPRKLIDIILSATLAKVEETDCGGNVDQAALTKSQMQALFQTVLWKMIQHGGTEDIVIGLHAVWLKRQNQTSKKLAPKEKDTGDRAVQEDVTTLDDDDEEFRSAVYDAICYMQSITGARDVCKVMQSFLQFAATMSSSSGTATASNQDEAQRFISHTVLPVLQSSGCLRKEIVTCLLLHRSVSTSSFGYRLKMRTCSKQGDHLGDEQSTNHSPIDIIPKFIARILAECTASDSEEENALSKLPLGLLIEHLGEISTVWCEPIFVNHSHHSHQRLLTVFILESLSLIAQSKSRCPGNMNETSDIHTVVTPLVRGVSVRLESPIKCVRKDGMRVAEAFAPLIGQEVHFEELDDERVTQSEDKKKSGDSRSGKGTESPKPSVLSQQLNQPASRKLTSSKKSRNITFDPDEEYISDDTSDASEVEGLDNVDPSEEQPISQWHEEATSNTNVFLQAEVSDDDDSDLNEDDFIPYDLSDDEEDLKPVKRPIYLRECLELLRTSDDDTDAYSKHEEAIKEIATIVCSRPHDLADLAVPLAKELLHMENKFDIPGFPERIFDGLTALTSSEPLSVSEYLIGTLFDSISTGTRLNILDTLIYAAEELSGANELRKVRSAREEKLRLVLGAFHILRDVDQYFDPFH